MKGSLYMEIKAPDGTAIYRGNGKETRDFTLNIPESGVYTIVACAKHAKRGMIQINKKSNCFQVCMKAGVTYMANEDRKDFNAMLHNSKDMPKYQIITE